jgi:hypothetical protein
VSHEAGQVTDEMRGWELWSEERRTARITCGGSQEINGFCDGEEVAARSGIGDGERKTRGDLAGEDFGDAAALGEDVAQAEDGTT